jgi:predicted GTPase
MEAVRKVIILGAAGRDFHNFNVFFRDAARYRVVAFTAAQIPNIAGRTYPPSLCGALYPHGIPIYPETELARLIRRHGADEVVFSYSDVTHRHVMHLASIAVANGASFVLLGPGDTMLVSPIPVIAVVAARTGAGKSTISRYLFSALKAAGRKPVVVRHPMPYGRLDRGVERYQSTHEIINANLTIEEMEEYQPHIDNGAAVYAGVDYAAVLERASAEGDVILWDGGNNDMAFFRPVVTVTVLDPLRPGEEDSYFPGEANIRAADVLVITKVNVAGTALVDATVHAARKLNPGALVVTMALDEKIDCPQVVEGRNVLVVEDGPSLTHGGLPEAGGARAARLFGASPVDPRPFAVRSIAAAFAQFPHIGAALPALGYSHEQLIDLQQTIASVPCDAVLLGTTADLEQLVQIAKPVARVRIDARDLSTPSLASAVTAHLKNLPSRAAAGRSYS